MCICTANVRTRTFGIHSGNARPIRGQLSTNGQCLCSFWVSMGSWGTYDTVQHVPSICQCHYFIINQHMRWGPGALAHATPYSSEVSTSSSSLSVRVLVSVQKSIWASKSIFCTSSAVCGVWLDILRTFFIPHHILQAPALHR